MAYTLDMRPGYSGGFVGLVKVDGNTVYATEELFGMGNAVMAVAEREYLASLKFEAELMEVDSVRKERY